MTLFFDFLNTEDIKEIPHKTVSFDGISLSVDSSFRDLIGGIVSLQSYSRQLSEIEQKLHDERKKINDEYALLEKMFQLKFRDTGLGLEKLFEWKKLVGTHDY